MIPYLLLFLLLVGSAQAAPVKSNQQEGVIQTGGVFQVLIHSNHSRHGCKIQNTSTHMLYVYAGTGTPTATNSWQVGPVGGLGGNAADTTSVWSCERAGAVIGTAIKVMTNTTGDVLVWEEY